MIRINRSAQGVWLARALAVIEPFAAALTNEGEAASLKAEVARVRQVGAAEVAEYEPAGYIKDDDVRDWNADDLLKSLKEGTAAANEERNTYAFGREGYVSINLLTDSKALDADKIHARDMLSRLEFNEGKRYADFDSKTDHVAEYGLAALVAGVAVKKLGLLALVGVTLLKFWKLGLIALAGVGSLWPRLRKRFGKQDATAPDA